MAAKHMIDSEGLRKLLRYDPETGNLYWRPRPDHPQFMKLFAGKRAFTAIDSRGYHQGGINRRTYLAHRVVWCIAHGYWPDHIDHINGDKLDNRLVNLREAGKVGNSRNQKRPSTNTSGFIGVSFRKDKKTNPWHARIRVDGKDMHIGFFATAEDANKARKDASAKHGFHPNHGRS